MMPQFFPTQNCCRPCNAPTQCNETPKACPTTTTATTTTTADEPLKKTLAQPEEEVSTRSAADIFQPIGLEEPIGLSPFHPETLEVSEELAKENTEYEEDTEQWFSNQPASSGAGAYTGDYSRHSVTSKKMMDDQTLSSQNSGVVTSQDPDGIDWLTPSNWSNSTWDGVPFDPVGKTNQEICDFLRPDHPYVIRGLRERFYEVNPFADNTAPTAAEIDAWNLEVIRHFRALLGNTTPVQNNARLFLEARWASERKKTEVWDSDYPVQGSYGDAYGPCWNPPGTGVDIAGGHCGASFFPDPVDRDLYIAAAPYNNDFVSYPELESYTNRYAQAEGISGVNTNVPWSIKLAKIIGDWICSEGLTGHPGPYVNPTSARENFGANWWYNDGDATVSFRGKWR